MVSSGIVILVACGPGYPGCMIKEKPRTGTALLSSVTAVQQGFIVRSRNINTSNRLPFVDKAQ